MAKNKDRNLWFPIMLADGRTIKSENDLRPEEKRYTAVKKQIKISKIEKA